MEHKSYPTKDMSFRKSDNDISPLNEALRGKAIMPALSSFASAGLEQSLKNKQELRQFLTTPISEDTCKKALSLEPQSIESLLQGDPMAILQAHLDIVGVSDPGPIFHDPALHVPKEMMRKTLGSASSFQDDLYGKMPYVQPTFLTQPPMSSLVQTEQHVPSGISCDNSYATIKEVMGSTMKFGRVKKQKYACKLCNAVFSTQQMYHGHMSLVHNK